MKLKEIKEIAIQHHINAEKVKKEDLVRQIQTAEGNTPCFNTGSARECMQFDCLWRGQCV